MPTGAQKQATADALFEASCKAFKQGKNKKALRLFNSYLRKKPCGYPKNTTVVGSDDRNTT